MVVTSVGVNVMGASVGTLVVGLPVGANVGDLVGASVGGSDGAPVGLQASGGTSDSRHIPSWIN